MGYDMYIENTPDDAVEGEDTSYFRLNIWGMSQYREIMHQLGMVTMDYQKPNFPEKPDSIDWEDVSAIRYPEDYESQQPVKPEAVTFAKTIDEHLAWHPNPPFGIALHKFASNDGWLVTPEEIAAALETYRTHSGDEVEVIVGADRLDYWLEWIAYLERARQRGGFRVH
ncbi:hypothetical protein [Streptomyces beihaiensis]|uniref:Uncharacterized protein n=1 Tax=Streptomyces beihaiensis TaxID=2984495 RepID=A0ABT3TSU6_9ACTN|nr:hypothetical protein [Streptomyces beihaiensis]MCX3059581.1 hypothetical protein [Streptomyces beihaiensis]